MNTTPTKHATPTTREILTKLVAFDTTSRLPNCALIDYVKDLLNAHGIDATIIPNADNTKANLYCTIGPSHKPGVMLSGHTDVVPIDGQDWTVPAFEVTEWDEKLYGRGTTDMKGFVASALAAALKASQLELQTPLHLGFSYDEEIGCVGVHSMIELLQKAPIKPAMCIVGEPTSLKVATQHKGKVSVVARCIGQSAHSALAPHALNAIHLASDFVAILRDQQRQIQETFNKPNDQNATENPADNPTGDQAGNPSHDPTAVPYSTVHVGNIVANQALNIVPNLCTVHFEIRYTHEVNASDLLATIQSAANTLVESAQADFPNATDAGIELDVWNAYPGLNTDVNSTVVEFVKSLVGANTTSYVAFGTEAGLFSEQVGIPTVVCGPGSMDQGHKADEFIAIEQLERCDAMMGKLLNFLCQSDSSIITR